MAKSRIIFSGGKLLDGLQAAREGLSVVVEGKRIAAIEEGPAKSGPDDRLVDLGGHTLMPGMVQGHFHACFGPCGVGLPGPVLGLEAPLPYMGMLAAKNVPTALHCGFTSLIGSSNPGALDCSIKDAIINGVMEGGRFLACTSEFVTSGAAEDGTNRSWFMELGNMGLIRRLDGPHEFRQAAREEIGRGCDVVKLSISSGHGTSAAREYCSVTDDELRAVVEVAHDRGKLVRVHCPSKVGILACARNGVDIIDHADRIDAECVDAILEADATVLPSMLWNARFLQIAENWDHDAQPFPIGGGFPEVRDDTLKRLHAVREDYDHTCEAMVAAHEAGVRMLTGDDFGFPMMPHGDYISEFEIYVKELGIPALDVIRWATRNGGGLVRPEGDLGTIEVGQLADLLVVDGDPSEDISCLRTPPLAILKDGEFIANSWSAAEA